METEIEIGTGTVAETDHGLEPLVAAVMDLHP